MKLISCHIENFGKLSDFSVDFSDGINEIFEENGWGKSTFAAFIRAMFYGFEGERKRSIEENERKRFKPWQGGVYGGQLTFEAAGKVYVISRIFKNKEAEDAFELRDKATNLISKDFDSKIGEKLFQIDRESFTRTVYIGQNDCETAVTDDINAKIGHLTDNTNDLNNFDSAYEKLTKIINELTPNRATGSLSKRKNQIAECERLVREGQSLGADIGNVLGLLRGEEERFNALDAGQREAVKNQAEASRLHALYAKKQEWDRLKQNAQRRRDSQKAIEDRFGGNVPDAGDVNDAIAVCADMNRIHGSLSSHLLTEQENARLAELDARFAEEIPSDEDMDAYIRRASEFQKMSKELSSESMNPDETARLAELRPYFEDEGDKVYTVQKRWSDRNAVKTALPLKKASLASMKASLAAQNADSKEKSGRKVNIPMIAAGAAVVVLGVVLAAAAAKPVGIALVVLGALLAAAGFILKKDSGKKTEEKKPSIPQELRDLEEETEKETDYIARVDDEVAQYLKKHGMAFDEAQAANCLFDISRDFMDYEALVKKEKKLANTDKADSVRLLKTDIETFLGQYGIVSSEYSFSDDCHDLKENVREYRRLKEKRDIYAKEKAEYEKRQNSITAFISGLRISPKEDLAASLNEILTSVNEYNNARNECAAAKAQLEQFEQGTDISALAEITEEKELPSHEELNEKIASLDEKKEKSRENKALYEKQLESLREKSDELDEKRELLSDLKEEQRTETDKFNLVSIARDKLNDAKEKLMSQYADPILDGFCRYYEMISNNDSAGFHIDANTKITADKLGQQRSAVEFSSGYRDLFGVCLRISLVDAMYKNEKPMLIMDDPFSSLDDMKIGAAKEFMNELAKDYQIIYFTCCKTRAVEGGAI